MLDDRVPDARASRLLRPLLQVPVFRQSVLAEAVAAEAAVARTPDGSVKEQHLRRALDGRRLGVDEGAHVRLAECGVAKTDVERLRVVVHHGSEKVRRRVRREAHLERFPGERRQQAVQLFGVLLRVEPIRAEERRADREEHEKEMSAKTAHARTTAWQTGLSLNHLRPRVLFVDRNGWESRRV